MGCLESSQSSPTYPNTITSSTELTLPSRCTPAPLHHLRLRAPINYSLIELLALSPPASSSATPSSPSSMPGPSPPRANPRGGPRARGPRPSSPSAADRPSNETSESEMILGLCAIHRVLILDDNLLRLQTGAVLEFSTAKPWYQIVDRSCTISQAAPRHAGQARHRERPARALLVHAH